MSFIAGINPAAQTHDHSIERGEMRREVHRRVIKNNLRVSLSVLSVTSLKRTYSYMYIAIRRGEEEFVASYENI